jgi:plasmid stabilization system protein ParE
VKLTIRALAQRHIRQRLDWYEREAGREMADRFFRSVKFFVDEICANPRAYPIIDRELQVRRCRMEPSRFDRFSIFYRIAGDEVTILAVSDGHQRPTRHR